MALNFIHRVAVVLCAGLLVVMPASAGIRAYNAAVNAGDYATAAAEAESIWSKFDKTLPETVATAREFAWTSMLADQPAKAQIYARWLVEEGANAPTPDDDPLMSKILLLWSELGKEPSRDQRAVLSTTLSSWSAANTSVPSRVAAVAAAQLYGKAWQAGSWKDAERDAKIAETLAGRLGAEGFVIEQRAILDGAAANFMDTKKADGYMRIADGWEKLVARIGPPRPGKGLDLGNLEPLYWRGMAWMTAMSAYFRVGNDRISASQAYMRQGDLIEARSKTIQGRCGASPCAPVPLPPGQLPQCIGTWNQSPPLNYPSTARFKGMLGATILNLTVDDAGKVTDVKVLAAVPSETFPEPTMKAVRQWTLERAPNAKLPCTLAGERQLTVQFQLH